MPGVRTSSVTAIIPQAETAGIGVPEHSGNVGGSPVSVPAARKLSPLVAVDVLVAVRIPCTANRADRAAFATCEAGGEGIIVIDVHTIVTIKVSEARPAGYVEHNVKPSLRFLEQEHDDKADITNTPPER